MVKYFLNNTEVSVDDLQLAADRDNVSVDEYIEFAKDNGLTVQTEPDPEVKKDQLQVTGASVEGVPALDTDSKLESGLLGSQPNPTLNDFVDNKDYVEGRSGMQLTTDGKNKAQEKYNKHYNEVSPINLDFSKLSLDAAVNVYSKEYDSAGFEFIKQGRGVKVVAPNGNESDFITSLGGGRGGYKGQSWSSVQEFVENNKDEEAYTSTQTARNEVQRIIFDIVERNDYVDLPGGDVNIKDSKDLYYNHPKLVQEIKNEALNRYNRYNISQAEGGFFGDSPFETTGISDYRLDKVAESAFLQSMEKDSEFNDSLAKDLILSELDTEFEGDPIKLNNWAIKGGVNEIKDPTEKVIASKWGQAYTLRKELLSKELNVEQKIEKNQQLLQITSEAQELSKEHLNPDNKILFNPSSGVLSTILKGSDAKEDGIDITEKVQDERLRLTSLKSGDFNSLKNQYIAHRIELSNMREQLNKEFDVENADGSKQKRTLKSLVDQYILGTGKLVPDMSKDIKAFGEKSEDIMTGTIQEVLDINAIESVAEEYLQLKASNVAFKDMYLLNIDPNSVERTGFWGSAGESFLESISSSETVDYYSGLNASDVLKEVQAIGDDAGINWTTEQLDNFKETGLEFLGTTTGGLPTLGLEFALANVAAGATLATTGISRALNLYRTGKYFKNGRKVAMSHDEILTAAAKDGYKGNIISKPIQTWIKSQPDIVKVGGGVVDQLKLTAVNSLVEGVKMEGVMGDGGFAMGATFTPAAALTNTIAGRLGLKFRAKGQFHKLNKLVLEPAKGGLVMIPSAEGGHIIQAAIEDYIGGKSFNTYMDENFNDVDWMGEGGIYRRLVGHAVAGSLLSYSHLRPKQLFKTINQQKQLKAKAYSEIQKINKQIEQESGLEGGKTRIVQVLKPKLEKQLEVYKTANDFINEAYGLNRATDPQSNANQASKDFAVAVKDYKKQTGKDFNVDLTVQMKGEGLNGKAASVTKREDGGFNIVVDARKYHKGILGHELGHVYAEAFGINNPEGLGKIVNFINETVKKNTGEDLKALVEKTYEGKQEKELNNEEYLMAVIEILGKGGDNLIRTNVFGEISQNLKGFYERKMKPAFGGKPPKLKIESPQELLNLLQRISKGVGKDGNVKQFQQLSNLYLAGKKIFDGETKEVKGTYRSLEIAEKISKPEQIQAIMVEQRRIAAIPEAQRTPEQKQTIKDNIVKIKELRKAPEEKVDAKTQIEKLNKLKEESKAIAEKFGKKAEKTLEQGRLEKQILESLEEVIGKVVTNRTKALYDPIAPDAKKGVSREMFKESMKSDIEVMVLNEYKGKQPVEKFIVNRGYLRANNLAERLGIKSVEEGITKGLEVVEKTAVETTAVSEPAREAKLIEPVERLVKDPALKKEFTEKVQEATKDLVAENVNYANLKDVAPEVTKKVFGEVLKPNGKIDKAKTKKLQQQFIRNNAEAIYAILPEGARKFAEGLKTATGIQSSLLKNFYEKGARGAMGKGTGTAAGLAEQVKKPFNKEAFLEVFGANKNQAQNRNQQTAIDALIKEVGKAMTNRIYRQSLEATEVSMNTIQKVADGKSINMASENISNKIGQLLLEGKDSQTDIMLNQLVGRVSRNLSKYFGELGPEIKNSAEKRNVSIEQIVSERILNEASYKKFYEKEGLEYTTLSEVGNGKRGKDLVDGLKIILESFGKVEDLPSHIKNMVLTTLGVNRRLSLDGVKINQKNANATNNTEMLNFFFPGVKYSETKWDSRENPHRYSYFVKPGKGRHTPLKIGGSGFNGKLESKIEKLKKKYNNKVNSKEFRKELIEFVRNELTHPELRNQAEGYELTMQANRSLMQDIYIKLYDAVKENRITKQTAADILRIQTNHAEGIFKILVPYESVTMGSIGRYRRGGAKNTHNEHMVELVNYNLDFLELFNKKEIKTREDAVRSINDLVNGLGQAVVPVPVQKVKDSRRFGGPAKQVYADKVLNTFLRTNSLNDNLIITGEYKGLTQGEALVAKVGVEGLLTALNNVPKHRQKKQWQEIYDSASKIKTQKEKYSLDLANNFNKIVEETTGVEAFKEFSAVKAKIEAGSKGKYKLFISASADDFAGLMNYNAGKGKQGEAHQAWFKKTLYDPYAKAYTEINRDNVLMARQFRSIKKHIKKNSPKFNLRKKIEGSNFTNEQALRAIIWESQKMEIPGLSNADLKFLKGAIKDNPDIGVLATNLRRIAGGTYPKPSKDWYAEDIAADLRRGINTTRRAKHLKQWKENVDAIFTEKTLNKLQAIHGTPYRKALENILDAMYTGKTRRTGAGTLEGRTLNYLNNSVGAIMFFNQRSATLQMLSSFNYMNWSDNNPLKAAGALANIPQFSKDFKTLFNSEWAKSRREGLRINVTESEIADAVTGSKNIPKSLVAYLLKKGFLPTQIADSMATALGGASFYRNRIKTYEKEGLSKSEAEVKAMREWVEISETNQQSSRPDKISMQQRSDLGKVMLAFANTPMQYTRLTKKAILDIKNNRGDKKEHLSKIAYYTFVQAAIFAGLQNAAFKMLWSDDEEDEKFLENKGERIINSIADGTLRGMGYGGNIVSMLKNTGLDILKQSKRGYKADIDDAAWQLLGVSPPISSKVGKVRSSLSTIDRAGGFEKAADEPFGLENPYLISGTKLVEATTNVPTNRALLKITNLAEIIDSDREWYEKLALLSGWKSWEIDPEIKRKPESKNKRVSGRRKGTR